jgi:hypothetical protein
MIYLTRKSNKNKPSEEKVKNYFSQFSPDGQKIMKGFLFTKEKFYEISDELRKSYKDPEKKDVSLFCIDEMGKAAEIAEELLTDRVANLSDGELGESVEEYGSPFMRGVFSCTMAINTCGIMIASNETLSWVFDDDRRKELAVRFLDDLSDRIDLLLEELQEDPNYAFS